MNQTVSLYEFDTVERVFSAACQTNCFQGEAAAIYDPCGNMISLVANSPGAEVWARAVDKNSTQAIGLYNPHAIEMPFVGDGTVIPPYEEPIVSPIAFTIGRGRFNVKDHLASNTDLTIAIGENGAHAYIGGDDDCEEDECDPCDPANKACPEVKNQPWYGSVQSAYETLKDMDCDELRAKYKEYKQEWDDKKGHWGGKSYQYYDPWSQKGWEDTVKAYFNPYVIEKWELRKIAIDGKTFLFPYPSEIDYVPYDTAIKCQNSRWIIATLQVIDCLRKFCKESDEE